MSLTIDDIEMLRQLSQALEVANEYEQMLKSGKRLANEFCSARLRFKDVPKVSIEQIRVAWEKIAQDAADANIATADSEVAKITSADAAIQPSQIQMWHAWKGELVRFKGIKWADQIERFQLVDTQL